MEKVEMRGKEVRKCQWEETVRCPRLVGQFSNAGVVGDDSVTFQSNIGDSKPGQLDSLVMPVLAMFLAMAKAIVMSIITICVGDCDGHELENNLAHLDGHGLDPDLSDPATGLWPRTTNTFKRDRKRMVTRIS